MTRDEMKEIELRLIAERQAEDLRHNKRAESLTRRGQDFSLISSVISSVPKITETAFEYFI